MDNWYITQVSFWYEATQMAGLFERMLAVLDNPRVPRGVDGFRRVSTLPTRTRTRAGFTRTRHGIPVPVLFPLWGPLL